MSRNLENRRELSREISRKISRKLERRALTAECLVLGVRRRGGRLFWALPLLENLSHLDLSDNDLGPEGAKRLAQVRLGLGT